MKSKKFILGVLLAGLIIASCTKREPETPNTNNTNPSDFPAITRTFGDNIILNALPNYANQEVPNYITKDNSAGNNITPRKATLGRVLFYDKQLSIDNTIACASCHHQEFAFGDTAKASTGVQGLKTARHSMRLVNARFGAESRFFWDKRAASLEAQTTQPMQDHNEMGFSGKDGRPALPDLLNKLKGIDYYQELFTWAYGDNQVTEQRLQECLAQFIRSIQSFDTKFDVGRRTAPNDGAPFGNFTTEENNGKQLFLAPPQFGPGGNRTGGGAGCQGCHPAPEFDIIMLSLNNGTIGTVSGVGIDLTVNRAPSIRELFNKDGKLNGRFMHTGGLNTVEEVIEHYNSKITDNANLDNKLQPGGNPQRLNLTATEKSNLLAFLKTLSGSSVYTDAKWSNPFK